MKQEHFVFTMSNIRDLLTIVFKHKRKIVATFLIVAVAATLWGFSRPLKYEAKSVLLIKYGREFVSRSDAGAERVPLSFETVISSEIKILTSKEVITQVISSIGLEKIYPGIARSGSSKIPPIELAVQQYLRDFSVRTIPSSSLIGLSFRHKDPEIAAKALKLQLDYFKEKHLQVFSGSSTAFLEQQLTEYGGKLRAAEQNFSSFKQRNRVFSLEEQRSMILQQKAQVDAALTGVQNEIRQLEQRIAFIKGPRWNADMPPEVRTQMLALQQREQELLEKYTENSRQVQNIRAELQRFQVIAQRQIEDQKKVESSRLENDLNTLRVRADGLRRQLGQLEGEVRTIDLQGREMQELRREITSYENNYQTYARRLEEARISDDMDRNKIANINVVEEPNASMIPDTKLRKKEIAVMGLLGGLIAGLVLAFMIEILSPRMSTPLIAEKRLGLPVMVAIPRKT